MPTGHQPDVYIWGLDIRRMPVALVRIDMEIPENVDMILFPIPEELFDNPEVFYAVPQDIEL